ncbi:MAG: hypothetical protein RSD07_12660 [Angelakisella sp.]
MTGRILCIADGMTHPQFTIPKPLVPFHKGSFDTTPIGHPTESLPCILSLLGLPPEKIPHNARGWLEALGHGISLKPDDLILRTTWVHTDASGHVTDYAIPPVIPPIANFFPIGGYKGLLIYPGQAQLCEKIETFAPYRFLGAQLVDCLPKKLGNLPQPLAGQNIYLIPWGQSRVGRLPQYSNFAFVGGTALVRGIALAMEMDIIENHAFTGDTDADLPAKTRMAMELAEQGNLVLLHINGGDEAAHRRAPREKTEFTERVVTECALPLLRSSIPTIVTSDHGTDPQNGCHIDLPQPFFANCISQEFASSIPAQRAISLLREATTWPKQ